ncbi:MAG TPA: SDR family oxidoreductase [Stellaceae bacterium]|nr:SDR family oxidoreductase [Stellaceae bacterium]
MGLFDLTGKVAVVTGSTRGIGRAIAEEMARAGARVVVSGRKQDVCDTVAAEIRQAGGDVVGIACHIGDKSQVETLVAKAHAAFGRIDILVLNAATNPAYGPLAEVRDEAFDKTMAVNVRSQLWLCALVLPEMAARRDGAIVFMASIGGFRGSRNLGAYAISKAAIMQTARSLAGEWSPHNIRINSVAPGLIRTDFSRALIENKEVLARRLATTPLGRVGEPIDVAGAVILLASDAGRFITGQCIVVDGGAMIAG